MIRVPPNDESDDREEEEEYGANGADDHSGRQFAAKIRLEKTQFALLRRKVDGFLLRGFAEPSLLRIRQTLGSGSDFDDVMGVPG
jgi:hypothetical protein